MILLLVELLVDLVIQVVGETVLEATWRYGGDRARRFVVFSLVGGAAGVVSSLARPALLFPGPAVRWAAILGSALVAGLSLALFEKRFLAGSRRDAWTGFLSGVAFSIAYAAARHAMVR